MAKCEFLITKGKKKHTMCGIYSSKMIGKKCYCAAHYNKVKSQKEEEEAEESSEHDEVVETKKKVAKKTTTVKKPAKVEKKTTSVKKPKKEEEESDQSDSLSEIEELIEKPKKKKYEPYKPSDEDLEEKDMDELLDEAIECEKDKPNDIKLMEKVDLLINKVAKIKRMIKIRKTSNKKPTSVDDDLEMEIFKI